MNDLGNPHLRLFTVEIMISVLPVFVHLVSVSPTTSGAIIMRGAIFLGATRRSKQ